jgi:predicted AAA+ superfamily ATPase
VFNEFLQAAGEIQLEKALLNMQIPEALHSKTMRLFNTFTLIGGMPEVIADYIENKDFVGLNSIYESLMTSYKDDVEKYAKNETMSQTIRYILQAGWMFAAQRITLGSFAGSSYKAREMGEAFRTLEKTFVLELCYPVTNANIPIIKDMKRSPKLLWLDSGLINYAAGIQKEVFGTVDITDSWRGKIAEQVVAQELLASDSRVSCQRNFWVRNKKDSDAEVDFVIQHDSNLIPIEVKSGHNAKLKSLHLFMDEASHNISIRVWSQPFSIDEVTTSTGKKFQLLNVPFYYVGILKELIKKHIIQ